MSMPRSDKYGIRNRPRIAASDYSDAVALGSALYSVISLFGKEMGMTIPDSFPAPIEYPKSGTGNANQNGMVLMDYTLTMTRLAFAVLSAAERRYQYNYKIEALPKRSKPLYYTQVMYTGGAPVTCVHNDYLRALIWVITMLNKSLEERYKNRNIYQ